VNVSVQSAYELQQDFHSCSGRNKEAKLGQKRDDNDIVWENLRDRTRFFFRDDIRFRYFPANSSIEADGADVEVARSAPV
jgi:hypothetical protein